MKQSQSSAGIILHDSGAARGSHDQATVDYAVAPVSIDADQAAVTDRMAARRYGISHNTTLAPVSAGVDLRALLREGCDLISVEVDALKAGISVNGEVRADPEDVATMAAIAEFEGWIGRCAAALRTPPPAPADGEGGEG